MKYTFSDEEDDIYSDNTVRRSTRNTRNHTPIEPAGPTFTQSGRQVRARQTGIYGESLHSGAHATAATVGLDGTVDEQDDDEDIVSRRPRRAAAAINENGKRPHSGNHIHGYNSVDDMEDEEDASEQDYGDEEEDEHVPVESDVDEPISDDDEEMENGPEEEAKDRMIVKLRVKTPTPEKKMNGIKLKLNLSSPFKPAAQDNSTELPSPTVQGTTKAVNGTAPAHDVTVSKPESLLQQVDHQSTSAAKPPKSPLPTPTSYMSPEKTNGFTPQAIGVSNGAT